MTGENKEKKTNLSKKIIMAALSMGLVFGVMSDVDAFRIGPRLGAYKEKYEDSCTDSQEWGIGAMILAESTPEKKCKNCHGNHSSGYYRMPHYYGGYHYGGYHYGYGGYPRWY